MSFGFSYAQFQLAKTMSLKYKKLNAKLQQMMYVYFEIQIAHGNDTVQMWLVRRGLKVDATIQAEIRFRPNENGNLLYFK